MALSNDLISKFVKATKETSQKKETNSTVYGTVVEYDDRYFVQLDGSELLTPVSSTADTNPGDRVVVEIKNHTATVTGNVSSPAARGDDVKDLNSKTDEIGSKITEFEIAIGDKVSVKQLEAEQARIDTLVSENVTIKKKLDANEASIGELVAENVTINEKLTANEAEIESLETNKLDAEVADITYATIKGLEATDAKVYNLEATYGEFSALTANRLSAISAQIEELEAGNITTEELEAKYANIDFANIGEAAIQNFYAKSGIIEDLVISEGTITGKLVGVTIKGDLIEGGTVVADKLVVKGDDGLYYKLNTDGESVETKQTEYNSLNGSIITANSITATKISVDDLVAFDATIGGFNITDSSLYSGAKASVDNTTTGVYLDSEGQVNFGDQTNYLKYYRLNDGTYQLDISAQSIILAARSKTLDTILDENDQRVTEAEEKLDQTSEDLSNVILEQTDIITQVSKEIVDEALGDYVQSSDYETFKQDVEAQLSVMDGEINANFTTTITRIEEVDGQLQQNLTQILKHIRMSDNGIEIDTGDGSVVLRLDNEAGIIFSQNGQAFGTWDGNDFYTGNIVVRVEERAQFGNFAFIPRSDGSLSFLKVGG